MTNLAGLQFPATNGVTPPQHPRVARQLDFGPEFELRRNLTRAAEGDGRVPRIGAVGGSGWNRSGGRAAAGGRGSGGKFDGVEAAGSRARRPWRDRGVLRIDVPLREDQRGARRGARSTPFDRGAYAGRPKYLQRVNAAADELIRRRFVTPQDRGFVVEKAVQL